MEWIAVGGNFGEFVKGSADAVADKVFEDVKAFVFGNGVHSAT